MKVTLSGLKEYHLCTKKLLIESTKLRKLISKKQITNEDLELIDRMQKDLTLLEKHISYLKPYYENLSEEQIREELAKPTGTVPKQSKQPKQIKTKKIDDTKLVKQQPECCESLPEGLEEQTTKEEQLHSKEVPIIIEKFENLGNNYKETSRKQRAKKIKQVV